MPFISDEGHAARSRVEHELLDLKNAALAASAANDADFYRGYLADDVVAITPAGVMDKTAIVQAAATGGFRSLGIADTRAAGLGTDAGVVTYRATFGGPSGPREVFVTTVYRRDADGWKGVLYQQTPLPEAHDRRPNATPVHNPGEA